jgi:hypothetical protein
MVQGALESEMLTYQLLRDNGIPVPAIHDWGFSKFSKTRSAYQMPRLRLTTQILFPGSPSTTEYREFLPSNSKPPCPTARCPKEI